MSYISEINEVDFCHNQCRYHNHEHGWCSYYSCKIDDVDSCGLVFYDEVDRRIVI